MPERPSDRALQLYHRGKVSEAIVLLEQFLVTEEIGQPRGEVGRALCFLGLFQRLHGDLAEAFRTLSLLVDHAVEDCEFRPHGWIELARVHHALGDHAAGSGCLDRAKQYLHFNLVPGMSPREDILLAHYYSTLGHWLYCAEEYEEALQKFLWATDHFAAFDGRYQVNSLLYIAKICTLLGRRETAEEYLERAMAVLKGCGAEYAYGLVHLFETVVAHNLFVRGSEQGAIEVLMNISEEVVQDFADFRNVFEFFSLLLVQLHGRRIDLDEIRQLKQRVGDQPLLNRFLPLLLTSAP